MAYTKTPTTDTYSQETVPLSREWVSRQGDSTGAKDEQYVNCFLETVSSKELGDRRQFAVKRSGSSVFHTPSVSGVVRGAYFWTDFRYLVYCIAGNVYLYKTSDGTTITCSGVFATTSGEVGICSYLYDTGQTVICVTDGTTLATIDSAGVVTPCADADLPTPHLPKPVFLDGYLFLVKTGTASLYNSDLNDPLAWTPGNLLDAEMDADLVVTLDKINNYIVLFGSTSVEYFWDAGVETGSPLQRNETPVKLNRYLGGLTRHGNALFFVGLAENGQVDVFRMQDFYLEPVGSPTITRYLNTVSDNFSSYQGAIMSCLGHSFYMLSAGDLSFVFDLDTKKWSRWSWQQQTGFPVGVACPLQSSSLSGTLFTIGSSNVFYRLNDSVYQDAGVNFTVTLITEPSDFGTLNRKSMSSLHIVCDRPSSASNITVQWSDDDYQTYSTAHTINLDQDLPSITRLGSFRQRAFKFQYTDNYPLRVQRLFVNINKGRT